MATRETRADRGSARGRTIVARLVRDLVDARQAAGLSQATVAKLLGWSQPEMSRFEHLLRRDAISLVDLARVSAVVGLDLSAGLHPGGEPIRDKGHQVVIDRFLGIVGAAWRVAREVPLPNPGDTRAWDLVIRVAGCIVGVEVETRVRDVQALVRRLHMRQRDGGANVVILVLAETAHNRRVLADLLEALGPGFATSPRVILRALREGRPIPGSGVVLV